MQDTVSQNTVPKAIAEPHSVEDSGVAEDSGAMEAAVRETDTDTETGSDGKSGDTGGGGAPKRADIAENTENTVPENPVAGFATPARPGTSLAALAARNQVRARLLAFQKIGAPLLAAVSDWRFAADGANNRTAEGDAALFAQLVESTVAISRKAAEKMGAKNRSEDDWIRWGLASAAADIVTAHYRATGRPMAALAADKLIEAIDKVTDPVNNPLKTVPKLEQDVVTALRLKMFDALAPVVGAVARFSFGYDEHALILDVAGKLHKTAAEIAAALSPDNCPEAEWATLYEGLLAAAAELYADCHYAEMDRLLDMSPDERAAYVREHGNAVPIEPVWQAFELRVSMLTTVAVHLKVPLSAQIAEPVDELTVAAPQIEAAPVPIVPKDED